MNNTVKTTLWTLFIVLLGTSVGTAAETKMYDLKDPLWEKPTALQKRLPPEKLPMVQADNRGKPLTDLTMIADRQAIINQVTAYSYLIDEDRWDEWFALFSDDIVFETTTPCFGTIRTVGKKAFEKFVNLRFYGPGSENKNFSHRHTRGINFSTLSPCPHTLSSTLHTFPERSFFLLYEKRHE